MVDFNETRTCAVCERYLLRGENHDSFLHDGSVHKVCELCVPRAVRSGWIRVGADDASILVPNQPVKGSFFKSMKGRLFSRPGTEPGPLERRARSAYPAVRAQAGVYEEVAVEGGDAAAESAVDSSSSGSTGSHWRVHRLEDELEQYGLVEQAPQTFTLAEIASMENGNKLNVSTSGQRMAERAVEIFNQSGYPATVLSVSRTLGPPWVTASSCQENNTCISITVAWELSWYKFEVNLANASDPVTLIGQGEALNQLDSSALKPNCTADQHGYLYVD